MFVTQNAVMTRGAELVRCAVAGIGPAALTAALDVLHVEVVAALGVRDAEEGHDFPPLSTVWSYFTVENIGYYMGHFMGDGLLNKACWLPLGDGEVVANNALAGVTDDHAGGASGQVEANVDFWNAFFPGLAEQWLGLGEVLLGGCG